MDRFGAEAVYGRPLRFDEMHRITHAESVAVAYSGFKAASAEDGGLAKWAGDNPDLYEFVIWTLQRIQNGDSQY